MIGGSIFDKINGQDHIFQDLDDTFMRGLYTPGKLHSDVHNRMVPKSSESI